MRNPTRRNRNIETAKQGHGQDNRMKIPASWHDDRLFYEKVDNAIAVERMIGDWPITFLVQPATAGFLLDLTDDVVDPRRGLRFDFDTGVAAPDSTLLGRDSEFKSAFDQGDIRNRRYGLSFYFPIGDQFNLAWNNQFFEARGGEGEGVQGAISGGSPPLRGYPAGRWSDRFGVFHGLDLRFNIPVGLVLDFALARGVVEDLQLAAFYEVGQVSPLNNTSLYEDMHESYGFGARILLEAIVLRLDLAFSDEGPQTHLTLGHAF